MSITIPDEVLESARLTAEEALQELAVALFQRQKLTLGQASRLAGMDRLRFQHLLASRGIPLHYDVAELEADLQVLRETGRL
jgi:predicted HTH domain antitoxin